MAIELKVPSVGESVTEVQIGNWLKSAGDAVEKDEAIVEIESDKATVEIYAPTDGTLGEIVKQTGDEAKVGDVVGYLEEGNGKQRDGKRESEAGKEGAERADEEPARQTTAKEPAKAAKTDNGEEGDGREGVRVMPAAQRLLKEHELEAEAVEATGPGNRLLKEDVLRHVEAQEAAPSAKETRAPGGDTVRTESDREEEVVPMSPMRKRIAQHLVSAQQTAALLTTFNEIDMTEVKALREHYKAAYQERYDVKLGFMSFFVKASIEALKVFPQVNAEVRETDIIYKNYYDIGIAVGGGKGLVVPILRNAERMSFAEIETTIGDFGRRAQENKITIEELKGGTFTISNGGIYGSLLSTPIVNPPQSAILGMHAIQDRPVVVDGEVVVRPMMYVALTYDHRIVDGREAVSFLKRIKECVEDPSRILLEI